MTDCINPTLTLSDAPIQSGVTMSDRSPEYLGYHVSYVEGLEKEIEQLRSHKHRLIGAINGIDRGISMSEIKNNIQDILEQPNE